MKKFWLAGLALATTACNNIETAMLIKHAAASSDDTTCTFDEQGDEVLANITFDAAVGDSLALMLRVENLLAGGDINFGTDSRPELLRVPNTVNPVRFDLRWECDSNGFSDDLGDLYLPQFSATESFCLSEDTRDFVGFDVVPATGNTIAPGVTGLVQIRPITAQLAAGFNDVFILASKAQACCDSAGGCDDRSLQAAPNGPGTACGDLQAAFDTIAGPGKLSATSFEDIQKFRPFALFDHSTNPAKTPGTSVSPSYPLTLRGVLEGVTADGTTVQSSEWRQTIHICANCIQSACTNF
ncbi:hypothetical protein L6R52_30735 [Myxococcota bacterium]|nr:hypothetical protein [Myxococcota bacterium]